MQETGSDPFEGLAAGIDAHGVFRSLSAAYPDALLLVERARTQDALNHAQRLERVGQPTGGSSHDFNHLPTVIQGKLQVLEELPGLRNQACTQQARHAPNFPPRPCG